MENRREEDGSVGLLVGFEESDEESWESGAGAVDGVTEVIFAVFGFEPEGHTTGLEVIEQGATGNFEVSVLAWGPDFDIESLGGTEAEIAGAEFDHAVVEAEELEDFFGVGGEAKKLGGRLFRGGDFDELDFIELVHPNEATGTETCGASFSAEARGVSGVGDGELIGVKNFFAMEVGDGDFGGGGEVEIAVAAAVELVFEFGELGSADEGFWTDDVRRTDFGVAVFAGVEIEEKIEESAIETGPGAGENGEGAAADFGGSFEVEEVEFFG